MATSFSGGRSRSTRREPPTMGKQLVNFITCGCILQGKYKHTTNVKTDALSRRNIICNAIVWFMIWFMVLNATFSNDSDISLRSVLLVEETGVPDENHRHVASHWQTLSHNVVSSTPRLGVRTHNISGDRHWFHR